MSNANDNLLEKWNYIKVVVDALNADVTKSANGNASAGIRARKGLRQLKNDIHEAVKLSLGGSKEEA